MKLKGWLGGLLGLAAWAAEGPLAAKPAWANPATFWQESAPQPVVAQAVRAYPPWVAATLGVAQAEAEASLALSAFDPLWRGKAESEPSGNYPKLAVDVALGQVLPQTGLRWEAGYRYGQGSFAAYEGKAQTNAGGELRAALGMPLLRNRQWDRRRADLAKAALGLGVARAEWEAFALEGHRELARRHWQWVAARGVADLAGALVQRAEARARDVRSAARLGGLAQVEALEAERGVYARRAEWVAAKRQVEAQALAYALWRRDAAGGFVLPLAEAEASLPALPPRLLLPGPERELLARVPACRRWRALVEGMRLEQDLAREFLLPALDFQALVSQDLGAGSPSREKTDVGVQLLLEWPLVGRGPEARVGVAELARRRGEAQLRLVEDQALLSWRDAASQAEAARARSGWLWADAGLADRLARLEGDRLRLGEGTAFSVNLREQVAFEAGRRAWEGHAEALAALAAQRAAAAPPELLAWLWDQAK